jgi:hypothetical protein
MAKLILLLLLLAAAAACSTHLRFLSWNLRYDSKPDTIPVSNTVSRLPTYIPADETMRYYHTPREAPWSTRRIAVAQEVAFTSPTIIGVQEALVRQVHDLSQLFGSGYSWIGVGRDDGVAAGEFEAIFWRNETLELLAWDTVALPIPFSPAPKVADEAVLALTYPVRTRLEVSRRRQRAHCHEGTV